MSYEPILVRAEMPAPTQPPPKFLENSVEAQAGPVICLACGRHHGSVVAEINCLRGELSRKRAEVRWLVGTILQL